MCLQVVGQALSNLSLSLSPSLSLSLYLHLSTSIYIYIYRYLSIHPCVYTKHPSPQSPNLGTYQSKRKYNDKILIANKQLLQTNNQQNNCK